MKRTRPSQRHVRVYDTLYKSPAFRTLPGGALKLWFDLRTQYCGSNNGLLAATLSTLGVRGWNSRSKLARSTQVLLARGLIVCTRYSGPNKFHQASLYGFTDLDVAANEQLGVIGASASHAYLR